jgi:hypothetical protein
LFPSKTFPTPVAKELLEIHHNCTIVKLRAHYKLHFSSAGTFYGIIIDKFLQTPKLGEVAPLFVFVLH